MNERYKIVRHKSKQLDDALDKVEAQVEELIAAGWYLVGDLSWGETGTLYMVTQVMERYPDDAPDLSAWTQTTTAGACGA